MLFFCDLIHIMTENSIFIQEGGVTPTTLGYQTVATTLTFTIFTRNYTEFDRMGMTTLLKIANRFRKV